MNHGYYPVDERVRGNFFDVCESLYLYNLDRIPAPITTQTILDVGCGRGGAVNMIKELYPDTTVIGVDYNQENINFCRETFPDKQFIVDDAESLSNIRDNSIDIVTNIESSHCYINKDQFLDSVLRVLKPGGWLVWSDTYEMNITPGFETIEFENIAKNVLDSNIYLMNKLLEVIPKSNNTDPTTGYNHVMRITCNNIYYYSTRRWTYYRMLLRKK